MLVNGDLVALLLIALIPLIVVVENEGDDIVEFVDKAIGHCLMHEAMQSLHPTPPLGLGRAMAAPWLTLWDDATGRLVRFRDARSPA